MQNRKNDFISIINACSEIGIRYLVIPLVDEGRIENEDQSRAMIEFLYENELAISDRGI